MGNKKKYSAKSKKSKTGLIVVIILLIIAAVAGVSVTLLFLFNQRVTYEDVRNYCERNGYSVSKLNIDTSILGVDQRTDQTITCKSSVNTISFYTFYEDVPGKAFVESSYDEGGMFVLGQGEHYFKVYHDPDMEINNAISHNYVVYGVVDKNTIISVSSPDEPTARRILVEIGYPDKDWYVGRR